MDTGASVRDRREALARLIADREDLDLAITTTRAEIAADEAAREETYMPGFKRIGPVVRRIRSEDEKGIRHLVHDGERWLPSSNPTGTIGKFCLEGEHWAPIEEFPKDLAKADGFSAYCTACSVQRIRDRREAQDELLLKDRGKTKEINILTRENRALVVRVTELEAMMIDQARDAALDAAELREGLASVINCIDVLVRESEGVTGLHRNGDVAPWAELQAGGRFSEWLAPLADARAVLASRDGATAGHAPDPPPAPDPCLKCADCVLGRDHKGDCDDMPF